MQVFAIKMHNFLRFGETRNSVVFDMSPEDRLSIENGDKTIDDIYEDLSKNPYSWIKSAKQRGITPILSIVGAIDGNAEASNGCGKSSILEAICYAHYGRIVRLSANSDRKGEAGLAVVTKINRVIPDYVKESWVEEFFETDGKIYRVKRGRSFTKTKKNSTPIFEFECFNEYGSSIEHGHKTTETRKTIDDVNDMSYELFVNSRMFGQSDAGKFLTGGDKTKKEMILELLNMTNFVSGCQEVTKTKKIVHEKNAEKTKQGMIAYASQIKSIYNKHSKTPVDNYSDSIVNGFDLIVSEKCEDDKISLYNIDKTIKELTDNIIKFSNSEKITVLASIKAEGISIKKERDDKLSKIKEQLAGWESSLGSTEKNVVLRKQELKDNETKIIANQSKIKLIKEQLASFDKEKHVKICENAKKAREAKSKYNDLFAEATKKKEMLIGQTASAASTVRQTHIAFEKIILQKQRANGGKLICTECESEVDIAHIEKKYDKLELEVKAARKIYDEKEAESKEAEKSLLEIKTKLAKIDEYIGMEAASEKELNNFKNLNFDLVRRDEDTVNFLQSKDRLEKEIVALEMQVKEAKEKIDRINKDHESEVSHLNAKLEEIKNKYLLAQEDAKGINNEIESFKKEQAKLEANKQEINQRMGALLKEKEIFTQGCAKLKEMATELEKDVKMVERYEKLLVVFGLDGIQTKIVKKYIPLLNNYIKEFIDILTDGAISLKMTINDKTDMEMVISGGTSDVYELLSGGERMLIRLAVDIALAMLSFARSAKKPEIIYLDEIFGPLDSKNTYAVLKLLNALKDKFSRVILITHSSSLKEMMPNTILVSKSGGTHGLSEIKSISKI